jgi:alginate O-acetyltransferase complex protein AlgI
VIATSVDLLVLLFYKYTTFILSNLPWIEVPARWTSFNILLPLGISFYVFQALAYVVDVYRDTIPAERNPLLLVLFIAFFPRLIAGPICRADELLPQLKNPARFDFDLFCQGILTLMAGLFLKLAIADNLSVQVNPVFENPAAAGSAETALAILSFGIVILADFWGYSAMAVGSALLFGINLPFNFNLPYISQSLQEFWRRWHITLSTWFRDYVFLPLEMASKRNPYAGLRVSLNLMTTMLLCGLWHGANWTFVVWGAIHGGWLVVEGIWRRRTRPIFERFRTLPARVVFGGISWFVTMVVVFVAWVFFRADNVDDALLLLSRMVYWQPAVQTQSASLTLLFMSIFLVSHIPLHWITTKPAFLKSNGARLSVAWWLFVGSLVLGAKGIHEFIYFQF